MQGRIAWFARNCVRKFRVPLELHVALGELLLSTREVRSPLELRGAPQDSSCIAVGMNTASSRVEAGTSGFLSISDIDLRVSADLEQGSQASSCVEARNSSCLLSCSWCVRPLVELCLEPVAFSGGCNQDISAPSCCDFILRVTFKEVPGYRDLP